MKNPKDIMRDLVDKYSLERYVTSERWPNLNIKPGETILGQPQNIRDELKQLTSDDIKDIRTDSIIITQPHKTLDEDIADLRESTRRK